MFCNFFLCFYSQNRVKPGFVVLCPNCGILSHDFNKCDRCQHKIPENVKTFPEPLSIRNRDAASGSFMKTGIVIPMEASQFILSNYFKCLKGS